MTEKQAKERYDIAVRVKSIKGICKSGHKVGDEWVVRTKTPAGICLSAFGSIFPFLRVLGFGGTCYWQADPDTLPDVACPDGPNAVVFELRRIRKKDMTRESD